MTFLSRWAAESCGIFPSFWLGRHQLGIISGRKTDRQSLGGDGWGEFFGVHANNTNSQSVREEEEDGSFALNL